MLVDDIERRVERERGRDRERWKECVGERERERYRESSKGFAAEFWPLPNILVL